MKRSIYSVYEKNYGPRLISFSNDYLARLEHLKQREKATLDELSRATDNEAKARFRRGLRRIRRNMKTLMVRMGFERNMIPVFTPSLETGSGYAIELARELEKFDRVLTDALSQLSNMVLSGPVDPETTAKIQNTVAAAAARVKNAFRDAIKDIEDAVKQGNAEEDNDITTGNDSTADMEG